MLLLPSLPSLAALSAVLLRFDADRSMLTMVDTIAI